MRSVAVAITIILFVIFSIPLYLVTRIIGLFNRRNMATISQSVIKWIFIFVLKVAGTRMTVLGVENIPADRAVLYAGNHRSYADIPMGYTTVPTLTGFIAKKEIARVPGLNWWMRNMNCLFLDRSDMRKGLKTILEAIELVKKGYSIFVMPEGTRNHSKELLPFKEGSFKVAEKTGCPIVPVAITNSDSIYELHEPWVRKANVIIHYGKPIEIERIPKEERKFIGARVREEIEKMLAEDAKR